MTDDRSTPLDARRSRPGTEGSYGIPDDGNGLLPWEFVAENLGADRRYWVTTVRPDGFPHARPTWGVRVDGAFHCGGRERTRWVRNLADTDAIVVHREDAAAVVSLEGRAERIDEGTADPDLIGRLDAAYEESTTSATGRRSSAFVRRSRWRGPSFRRTRLDGRTRRTSAESGKFDAPVRDYGAARYWPCLIPISSMIAPKTAIEGTTIIRTVSVAIIPEAIIPIAPSAISAMNVAAVVGISNSIRNRGTANPQRVSETGSTLALAREESRTGSDSVAERLRSRSRSTESTTDGYVSPSVSSP